MWKFTIIALSFTLFSSSILAAEDNENENTLRCLVAHLKTRGVQEDFFDSVSTRPIPPVDCVTLINGRLSKAYSKIESKLKADSTFSKYTNCVLSNLKLNDSNTEIMLRREAIKLNGLGIAVWNYFSQKEYLDKLKKEVENNINAIVAQKCVMVH